MTEEEWLACTDPTPMLVFLRGKASDRKLRLFACASFSPVREFFSKVTQKAVDVAERFADGRGTPEELSRAFRLARGARKDWQDVRRFQLRESPWDMAEAWADDALRAIVVDALRRAGHAFHKRSACGLKAKQKERRRESQARQTYEDALWLERKAQADLLRDISGNPFRPFPPLFPAVLKWNDAVVLRIAQGIYDERRMPEGTLDNGRLAILHDALLDAGCSDEELLTHCLSPGLHVRGCWAIDMLTGRE